jgi:hypothetical protein
MMVKNLDSLMAEIEEHVGDCKIEIHKVVALDHAQQVKIALAFEEMLDRIEDAIRNATGPA